MKKIIAILVVIIIVGGGFFYAKKSGILKTNSAIAEQKIVKNLNPALRINKSDIVMGKADAPVTIIEYASLSCMHCAHFHNDIFPEIKKNYIDTGKAKFVMRNFPLNDPALKGAMLTSCVDKSRYYPFIKVLFKTQKKWAFNKNYLENMGSIASIGGVSPDEFDVCMKDIKREKTLLLSFKKAGAELNIQSTPTFFVNGKMLRGAKEAEEIPAIIDHITGQ